jgi:RHS repeat-associated protein
VAGCPPPIVLQPNGPTRVEAVHPVAKRLQFVMSCRHAANLGCIRPVHPVPNRSKRQQPTTLVRVFRRRRQPPQVYRRKNCSKSNRSSHDANPPRRSESPSNGFEKPCRVTGQDRWYYVYNNRLSQAKIGTTIKGNYVYDGFERLAVREVLNTTPSGKTHFLFNEENDVIAETSAATGASFREYIWLPGEGVGGGGKPIAVIDQANTATPKTYWISTDHLDRPVLMTDATRAIVWRAEYRPFGEVISLAGPAATDANLGTQRFPGQWFQLETGLAYNWHRHYDASLGRYTQVDPMNTETPDVPVIGGLLAEMSMAKAKGVMGLAVSLPETAPSISDQADWMRGTAMMTERSAIGPLSGQATVAAPVLPDGPSRYSYAKQSPAILTDRSGLLTPINYSPIPGRGEKCGYEDLRTDMLTYKGKGGDPCFALRDLNGRGIYLQSDIVTLEKFMGCRNKRKQRRGG